MSNVIRDAAALWTEIAGTAKFERGQYDEKLLEQIAVRLGLPGHRINAGLLQKNGISCETLLQAVLLELLPFSQMLNDLLKMFQEAQTQQSDHNLKIQFDFSKNRELFQTDLDFFRQQTEAANSAVSSAVAIIPMCPFDLLRGFTKSDRIRERTVLPNAVEAWLNGYYCCPSGNWPDHLPARPVTGFPKLDGQLGRLWDVLNASLWKYQNEFEKGTRKNDQDAEYDFWRAEEDRCLGQCVRAAYSVAAELEQMDHSVKLQTAKMLAHSLHDALENCRMFPVEQHRQYQAVLDILNLPFWKKRYELYSVWVSTQILAEFRDCGITYHAQNNTISFSFGGSHIATIGKTPPLELWTEVRTPYDTPKGHSRKHHIQPDYTLAVGDAVQKENSVAVVECKQYKKYSRSNFLNAAEDYAGGRPDASVFLVNYGPVPQALQDQAAPAYRDRIRFHGGIFPKSPGLAGFRKELRSAVDTCYAKKFPVQVPRHLQTAKELRVHLRWGERPLDLDLHMIASDWKQGNHVCYDSQYRQNGNASARLNGDVQSGDGLEIITLAGLPTGRCDFYVHDYHGTNTIQQEMQITVEVGGETVYEISRAEPIPKECCWHPISINGWRVLIVDALVGCDVLGTKCENT